MAWRTVGADQFAVDFSAAAGGNAYLLLFMDCPVREGFHVGNGFCAANARFDAAQTPIEIGV